MNQAAAPTRPAHLLLAVTADGDALALVEHARRVSASLGATWSVVGIDAAVNESVGQALRASLLEALDLAERLGATTSRISPGAATPTGLVSSLVHRAISEQATLLMIGRHRQTRAAWPWASQSSSEFVDVLSQLLPAVTVHLVSPPVKPLQVRRWLKGVRGRPIPLRHGVEVLLTLAVCTLACAVLERYLHPANLVMVFLAGVVSVASRLGRTPAVATVLGSIFLYNLIFVPPRWSLKPTEPQYWLAFLVMMIVGLIISQLAARTREQALVAEARAQRTQTLNQLSLALGKARDADAVARALCEAIHRAVGVDAMVLPVHGDTFDAPAGKTLPAGFDPIWARQALASSVETGAGTAAGTTQALRYVPLVVGVDIFGLLLLQAPDAERDTLEDQHLVRALATQAAVAMERATFEGKSVAAAIEAEGERTRNTLLAGISHDFRTPLTTIMGTATTLIEQSHAIDDAHRMSLLQGLLGEAQRLHLLTSNLLDLTRLDEGAIQLRPEWCPADELLGEALDAFASRLGSARLEVTVSPEAVVWCDPVLIGQVAANLVDNAVRHGPAHGRIRVAVLTQRDTWSLSVHDEGPGVAPGHERAIFRKFYQAADDGDSTGKGLGLAICAAVARLHGGGIHVVNDGGARFVMTLPQPELPALNQGELD
jgi:two-component system, OmpR family, sensor histidine kinase KdpD